MGTKAPPDLQADGEDEDPNSALRPYASPPCYAHEVDPAYFGLAPAPDGDRLADLNARLREAEAAIAALGSLLGRARR